MKAKSTKYLPVILLVIAAAVLVFVLAGAKHDDKAEIETALKGALQASREGRPGGVVEYLASDVEVNGQHYDVNRQFDNFIRKYHPDITLGEIKPDIEGDKATVTSDIQFSVMTQSVDIPDVTFTLKREDTRKWLVIPSQEWKVTGASAPEQGYQQILSQLQMMGGSSMF